MKIEGIIFDLDGTLIDSIDDLGDAANILFARHGYPEHKKSDFIQWIGDGTARFIQNGIGNVIDKKELKDYVSEYKQIYLENLHVKTRLYEGVNILLDELGRRRLKLSVLSNKPDIHTLKLVDHFFSEWSFECVAGQKEGIPRKPDPSSALAMAAEMGISPEKILFIGDSAGDIKTALSAGMVPVWVSWGYGNPEAEIKSQSIIVKEPEEILSLLR